MTKAAKKKRTPEMLDEYDFSKGVRGKYAQRYSWEQTWSCWPLTWPSSFQTQSP